MEGDHELSTDRHAWGNPRVSTFCKVTSPFGMKGQAFHPIGLGLELRQLRRRAAHVRHLPRHALQ